VATATAIALFGFQSGAALRVPRDAEGLGSFRTWFRAVVAGRF